VDLRAEGVYVITGGGGDIAGAIAGEFAEAGARLALVDVSAARVAERAGRLGALAIAADLTDAAQAEAMVHEARERWGRIDGLIHTAGAFAMAPAHESDTALYDRMFDVNVRTLFNAVRAALPTMLEQDDGFIAAFSSSAVWQGGTAGMTLYAAAKGAVALYLRSLEKELRRTGVRVAVVYPMTPVDTPANRRAMPDADPEGWVDAGEIARMLLFAATRGRRGRIFELPVTAGR
jgi:NADP-dependent 3-hydroxy acid dehydrogenase YdfG